MRNFWLLALMLALGFSAGAQATDESDTVVVTEAPVSADEQTTTVESEERSDSEENTPKNYLLPVRPEDRAPVAARSVPPAQLDSMRRSKDYWYWNHRNKEERPEGKSWLASLFESGAMRYLFWALIALGCAALLYFFLLSLNVNPFARRVPNADDEGTAADAEADFFSRDYDADVARALAAGDYRSAIRARYLQLLREMAGRNIIQYRHERPNGVYVSQLLGTNYFNPFFRITRTFEYAWYGEMAVTRAAYDYMEQDIDHLKKQFV
ncbi:DUF4129 domain-containing protein [Flaviaesturariibacter flavus]|uniref:DUF4129 domain-containing protein n=1 Tax=Flaviaesturariibacter flavus TaxID=2502780 RepID=A0A4R1BH75_9BACT|nr:DUF4129 domain-containing protein [Flaviaesturariibacter flavus]TCJ16563.1 DUF4129 domain-containing protein [Flaviaesturariibacter flavus]